MEVKLPNSDYTNPDCRCIAETAPVLRTIVVRPVVLLLLDNDGGGVNDALARVEKANATWAECENKLACFRRTLYSLISWLTREEPDTVSGRRNNISYPKRACSCARENTKKNKTITNKNN